jgi:tRNA(Glu) U13 pseudouridine synthase TruD
LAPLRNLGAKVEDGNLFLTFDLTRGSYATSLVREFAKGE